MYNQTEEKVTKDVELVMEMLNGDYAGMIMESQDQTREFKRRFKKGLKELNKLVNEYKR